MIACEYYVMVMMLHNIMRTDRETSITLGYHSFTAVVSLCARLRSFCRRTLPHSRFTASPWLF